MNNEKANALAFEALTSGLNLSEAPIENSQHESQQQAHEQTQSQLNESTSQNDNSQLKKGYSFYSAREFYDDIETENYLIDGYVQKEALQIMFGEPGCGKTFTAGDISYCISCDEIHSWHGRDIEHGDVVYFVGESIKGAKKRFRGWCDHNHISPEQTRMHFCDEAFKIDDDAPEHNIDTTIAEIRKRTEKPVLIVIDTVNVFMQGDENKTVDAGKFTAVCKQLIKVFGCTVLIVHHVGNSSDAKNRARGSSVFKGNVDIEIKVTKNDNVITLTQLKHKEGKTEKPLNFNLSEITIPGCFDKKGRPITTCVIELHELQNTATTSEPEIKLSQYEKTAIRTFIEAVKRHGIRIKDKTTRHELAAIEIERWRKVSYELSTKDNPVTKRTEFNQGREKLCHDEKKILLKQTIEGYEYYCLDLNDDVHSDATTRLRVRMALCEREKAQAADADAQPKKNVPDAQFLLPIEPQPKAAQSEHTEKSAATDAANEPAHGEPPQP